VNPLLEAAQGVIRAVDSGRPLRGDHDEITLLRWAIASATEREAAVERVVSAVREERLLLRKSQELHRDLGTCVETMNAWNAYTAMRDETNAALAALSREVKP
jgi:hypothetical protein